MRRQAGSLRAKRLLDHLDEDLLSFFEEIFNFGVGTLALPLAVARPPLGPGATRMDGGGGLGAFGGGLGRRGDRGCYRGLGGDDFVRVCVCSSSPDSSRSNSSTVLTTSVT